MSQAGSKGNTSFMDRFLEDAHDTHRPVSLYLVSGFQLKGEVVGFDQGTVLFKHRDTHQLVMRQAIATLYPLPESKGTVDEWWTSYLATAEGE